MNKILTALYDSFYTPLQAAGTREEIKTIHKQLILKLDKPERRLVLRLIDAKNRLAEEASIDSFVCGFRLAWRLANELNSYPESWRPIQSGQTERDARCTPQERWELPDGRGLTPPRPWPPLVGRCVAAVAPCSKREGLSRECPNPSSRLWQKFRQHPILAAAPPDDLLRALAAVPFTVTLLQEIHIWTPLPNRFNEDGCTGCIFPVNARILLSSPGI